MIPGVCQSTSLSVSRCFTRLRCAKTTERIEVLFGMKTLECPGNIVLDGEPQFPHRYDAAFAKALRLLVLLHASIIPEQLRRKIELD